MTTLGSREGHPLCAGSLPAAIVVIAVLTAAGSALAAGPPAGFSTQEWATIQAQIEAEHHKITDSDRPGRLYRADNPSQRFTAHFGAEDVLLEPRGGGEPAWQLGLRLTAWGSADDLQPVHPAGAIAESNRVELRRGPLTEWYVNTSMGLEQGFTIDAPPGDGVEELVLEMAIQGDLTAELAENAGSVTFRHGDSTTTLTYSGLKAWDAVAEPLDARMELTNGGSRLRLVISVNQAAWPIEIDPIFTQVAKLLPDLRLHGNLAGFGRSVALDGDLLVASIRDHETGYCSGAAHVFRYDNVGTETWIHVAKLVASDGVDLNWFGYSVSVDDDTIVVGAPLFNSGDPGPGSAYVFSRDQGGTDAWGEVAKLNAGDGAEENRFGASVSISGDAIVVGAHGDRAITGPGSGSAYVFHRNQGGADAWGQVTTLNADDLENAFEFGDAVAISGDTVVVGATLDMETSTPWIPYSGSAYIFQRDHGGPNAWGQVVKLAPIHGTGDGYGYFDISVAVDGDTVFVGSPYDDHDTWFLGSVYVFERNQGGPDVWGQVASIIPNDSVGNDQFGFSVSISGDTAVVGSASDDVGFPNSGSAYVFERHHGGSNAWGQAAKISSSDPAGWDYFGAAVSISGDTVIVGASHDDGEDDNEGSVYVYRRDLGGVNAWGQDAEVPRPPVFVNWAGEFGASVSIDGDTVLVGASEDVNDTGTSTGAAYIFQRDLGGSGSWDKVAKILASDGTSGDQFGVSVAVDEDTALVGATGDDDHGEGSGSAYVFHRDLGGPDNWGQIAKITSADASSGDAFGRSVAISGDTAVIGAYWAIPSGSAYVFGRNYGGQNAWGQIAKMTPSDSNNGSQFGITVAIEGDTAIAGAPYHSFSSHPGSAYVFGRHHGGADNWGEVRTIAAPDSDDSDYFGWSVAIAGDLAVIGAPRGSSSTSVGGTVYLFEKNLGGPDNWGLATTLVSSNAADGDGFGEAVAIVGDDVMVGAPYTDDLGSGSGSAYVFRRNHGGPDHWGEVTRILAADGATTDNFGSSVAQDGASLVIGAPHHTYYGSTSGSAYIYTISDAFFANGFESGDTSEWSVTVP